MNITRINIIYTSMFSVSFVLNIPAVLLTYQFCKKAVSAEYWDQIYLVISLVMLLLSLIESFQWIFLFSSETSCIVLAAFREYALISLLVIITCTAIHLLLLVKSPKWLMVIDEVKRRRYGMLIKVYYLATFLVPLLFVPWPFVAQRYGKSYFMCWIIPERISSSVDPYGIEPLLLLYIEAILVWAFTMCVIAVVLQKHCCSKTKLFTTNFVTLLSIMVLLLIAIVVNLTNFVVYLFAKSPIVYLAILYISAVGSALPSIIASVFLIVRACKRRQKTLSCAMNRMAMRPNEIQPLIA